MDGSAVRVGLVGAGPWAALVHAPMLAAGPETTLAGVWARRPDAAAELAGRHGANGFERFEELLDASDAIAFCVPPAVQAEMAVVAARAGKALLLEKPIAADLDGAERLADAVGEHGVGSMVLFTARYDTAVRTFLEEAANFEAFAAVHENLTGAFLAGPFSSSPWRHEQGVLADVGPHAVDLLTAALGPVGSIRAAVGSKLTTITIEHEGGASSTSLLSAHLVGTERRSTRLYSATGELEPGAMDLGTLLGTVRSELAEVARSRRPHPCDVHRGLQVQRWLHAAAEG
jgi:predicted dehydrogenase